MRLLAGNEELGGVGVRVEGIGGHHPLGKVQALQQRPEARDFAGGAVDLALRQHRTAGVVHRGEQVDLAAVWGVSGAGQGLAIDRDRPPAAVPAQRRRCSPLAPPSLTTLDTPHTGSMDDAVRDYIQAIDPRHRPLFDRLHRLVLEAHPDAALVLSYQIPTYKVGRNRLFLGVWKHGVSVYGFQQGHDGGFIARHPELKTSKGTIRLRPEDAAGISDEELRELVRSALDG